MDSCPKCGAREFYIQKDPSFIAFACGTVCGDEPPLQGHMCLIVCEQAATIKGLEEKARQVDEAGEEMRRLIIASRVESVRPTAEEIRGALLKWKEAHWGGRGVMDSNEQRERSES